MSEHLSSEQVSRWMMGERRGPEEEHVRGCATCRAELDKMETTLAEFRRSVWRLGDRQAGANPSKTVGQTPWSARDAHVPLLDQWHDRARSISRPTGASAADQGVCPTFMLCPMPGKLNGIAHSRPLRWVLAATAVLILGTTPLLKNARDRQRDAADALLMDQVDEAISRTVPRPMEPLIELVRWGGPTDGKEITR